MGLSNFETAPFDRSGTSPRAIREGQETSRWHPRHHRRPGRPHRRSAIRGRPSGSRKGKRKGGATKSRARGFRDRTCQIRQAR